MTSTDYPAGDTFHGSPGLPGEFTFSDNGVPTATDYYYGFNDDSCTTRLTPDEQGGSVTVTLTPRQEGPNWIYARTMDDSGRSSDCELVHSFLVAPLSGPVVHLAFDEGQGNRVVDAIDPQRGATLSDGVDWVRGRLGATENPGTNPTPRMNGTAVHLGVPMDGDPGTYGRVTADHPAVDTSGTFSVAAWVRLDRADADHTAVAQQGTRQSAFHLGYEGDTGRWVFEMSPEDGDGPLPWTAVTSTASAQVGVWTHLLGVHDSRTHEITLYVDGVEQGEAAHTGAWDAPGPLTVGRGLVQGVDDHHWPGSIDDVRVWDRVVLDHIVTDHEIETEVWRLANRPVAPEGRWTLDEYDGTVVADSTDHGLDATLHGDPLTAWNFAENGVTASPGVRLNGVDEYIATADPALRTDRSFSVAAWVRLDETGGAIDATALAQSGPTDSAFRLGHRGSDGRWTFTLTSDGGSGAGTTATSTAPARLGEWTHLVGVYDHTRKETILYVNGREEGRVAVTHAWHADGPVYIGAAREQGAISHHWNGDIDDVHAYQGVLNERDRDRVYMGEFPNIQV
ncbi:LamG domain-containing protein [Nocardiopsis sp. N85]|uniref:LamG domain-containing protein n=1 Tax=Nocardiopsis sp. N85 TaxID=3029400 RepID=UPI003157F837